MKKILAPCILIILVVVSSCRATQEASTGLRQQKDTTEASQGLLKWSDPVNGLRARVESCIIDPGMIEKSVFVRFENVSDRAILLPVSRILEKEAAGFELNAQSSAENKVLRWHRITLRPKYLSEVTRVPENPYLETIKLLPGKSTLFFVYGFLGEEIYEATTVTVRISAPDNKYANVWHGTISTPEYALYEDYTVLHGKLALPDCLPDLFRKLTMDVVGNAPFSPDRDALYLNYCLSRVLKLYRSDQVQAELNRRMVADKDHHGKMPYMTMLASLGDSKAKDFILEATKAEDKNLLYASILALASIAEEPQVGDWAIDRVLELLTDKRTLYFKNSGWFDSSYNHPVWYLASENLYNIFARLKYLKHGEGSIYGANPPKLEGYSKAVTALAALAKREEYGFEAIRPLGVICDSSAISHLIEILESQKNRDSYASNDAVWALSRFPEDPRVVASLLKVLVDENRESYPVDLEVVKALGICKAKEAVPVLLKYVAFPEVVEALGDIGDKRAVKRLERLVAANGKVPECYGCDYAGVERERRDKAKVALALLKDEDVIENLGRLLEDKNISEHTRCDIVRYLALTKNGETVKHMLNAIKEDPVGSVTGHCIGWLDNFKTDESIRGLIESFDVDFSKRKDWKPAYTPMQFKYLIAESLRKLTEQKFGADKQAWQAWYEKNKDK